MRQLGSERAGAWPRSGREPLGLDVFVQGGAVGALLRAHEWSSSPLGPPETWPQSLRTVVGLLLDVKSPMFVAWGPELGFLYNDAYAEILGSKHPAALGRPFQEIWSEIWADIRPLIDRALAGEATFQENVPLTIRRRGFDEQAWFTFSYSPARDETGMVAGMFCACTETTEQVLAARRNVAERERLEQLFEQAPGFMAMLRGPEHVFELVNRAYLQLVGHRDVIGKPVRQVLPEIEGQGFFELLDKVYATGEAFNGTALKVGLQRTPGGPVEERFVDLVYQPVSDAKGRVTGIFAEGSDVTERVHADEALREREERLRLVVEGAKDHAIFTTDLQSSITTWSAGAQAIFGWTPEEAVGRSASMIFTPEDRAVGADQDELATAAREGYANDERWHMRKDGARVFMNGSMHPLHDAAGRQVGFLKVARDDTARRATFESAARLAAIVSTTPDAIISFSGEDGRISSWNKGAERLFGYTEAEAVGASLDLLLPPAGRLTSVENETGVYQWALEAGTIRVDSVRRRKDGTLVDVSVAAARMEAPDGRVLGVSAVFRDITERKQAEERLRESEARFQGITNSIDQMIWSTLPDGFHDYYNQRWYDYTGMPLGSTNGEAWNDMFHPDDQERAWKVWRHCLETGEPYHIEYRLRHRSGQYRWVLGRAQPVRAADGRITRWFGTCTDIQDLVDAREVLARSREELERIVDERTASLMQAEEQLRQAQKMEAVGQLTGGIAHDFNNLLAGIVGSLDLLQTRIAQGRMEQIERYSKAAMSSAQRAAALTHRLLAFSRRQPLDPKPIDANQLITSMEDLLRRTIGPSLEMEIVTAGGLWTALCDAHQLESAILNLAINARDAMPDGGKLTIETCNAHLDNAYAAMQRDLEPGQYICLCVTDTGTGMGPDVIARAFDPFFTTKPMGQGTGLGLSMVYGFAKQSEGHVRIYSEEGKGTTVKIYLPRHRGDAAAEDSGASLAEPPRAEAGETVLVVEDEPVVRGLIVEVLEELGYRTLEAGDGPAGLKILNSKRRIDLLVSDVGLPGMNGRQLADHARERRPNLKVLFITGYAENATMANGFLDHRMAMMTKPFAVDALASRVRSMIRDG